MIEKESVRKVVAQNVRKYRKQNNLTQEKLAKLAEISNTYIANIECGKTWISDRTLEKISRALHTDIYLFFIESKTEETGFLSDSEIQEDFKRIDEVKMKICSYIQEFFDEEKKRIVFRTGK